MRLRTAAPFRSCRLRSRAPKITAMAGGPFEKLADKLGVSARGIRSNQPALDALALCKWDLTMHRHSESIAGDEVYADLNGWRLYLRDMKADGGKTMAQVHIPICIYRFCERAWAVQPEVSFCTLWMRNSGRNSGRNNVIAVASLRLTSCRSRRRRSAAAAAVHTLV